MPNKSRRHGRIHTDAEVAELSARLCGFRGRRGRLSWDGRDWRGDFEDANVGKQLVFHASSLFDFPSHSDSQAFFVVGVALQHEGCMNVTHKSYAGFAGGGLD
jgi:hypothetical protein